MDLTPGIKVANGAIIIASSGDRDWCVVLCVIPGNTVTPYATWAAYETESHAVGNRIMTVNGEYFRDLPTALKGFNKRAGIQ